ncbi:MAG: hypothetical protein KC910_26190, partial [Candidatus Eremiobacteraeota bacterium]|nr:hypothetical protein [Candidatus Eremiobacteraeota bacterium]
PPVETGSLAPVERIVTQLPNSQGGNSQGQEDGAQQQPPTPRPQTVQARSTPEPTAEMTEAVEAAKPTPAPSAPGPGTATPTTTTTGSSAREATSFGTVDRVTPSAEVDNGFGLAGAADTIPRYRSASPLGFRVNNSDPTLPRTQKSDTPDAPPDTATPDLSGMTGEVYRFTGPAAPAFEAPAKRSHQQQQQASSQPSAYGGDDAGDGAEPQGEEMRRTFNQESKASREATASRYLYGRHESSSGRRVTGSEGAYRGQNDGSSDGDDGHHKRREAQEHRQGHDHSDDGGSKRHRRHVAATRKLEGVKKKTKAQKPSRKRPPKPEQDDEEDNVLRRQDAYGERRKNLCKSCGDRLAPLRIDPYAHKTGICAGCRVAAGRLNRS